MSALIAYVSAGGGPMHYGPWSALVGALVYFGAQRYITLFERSGDKTYIIFCSLQLNF